MVADLPLIPTARRGGNKRTVGYTGGHERSDGCSWDGLQWREIPKDLPPRSTVNYCFCRWQHDGTPDRLHHALSILCREQADREARPTAAIIDSQIVKGVEKGGRASIVRFFGAVGRDGNQ